MRSTVLVTLQLGLVVAIMFPWQGRAFSGAIPVALITLALALGLWALTANPLGNFNVRPEPKDGGMLATTGPYRWIRHPMYAAVLLGSAGFCLGHGGAWRWGALAALAVVLHVKASVEEAALAEHHPGYADYARRTKRVLPFVY
jgi:protein-S-isoprenylcysteine O-methyltransferase Ste14